MFGRLRALTTALFTPLAALLLRLGVSPDAVTITGTLGVVVGALWLFPTGHLFAGTMVVMVFAFSDVLDGVMARRAGRSGPWGAFLDSTLDRIADAAVFVGLTLWFVHADDPRLTGGTAAWGTGAALACLALGAVVPYARARAESVGMTANVGIAERADRLVVALVAAGLVGLGVVPVVLVVVLTLLAVASAVTVVQRMAVVRRQALAQLPGPGAPGGDPGGSSDTTEGTR
ncbi:phosphatidylinositol phosphate synthase [Cellulosimicrobium arenosum]|uniref:Phosphatidylinositol phosphate synthase n=1 Tax=Cellulosimicrobium arenosum TaxID=2708133 RepID=A0A927G6N1_9MICO|nr:CDP-alcohol phosphatidyltransferase family protein [Cellulosimicrobium arenosum]MBD8077926.1 CDP-alcohol phosphatidyltransferase family protein [Cellulosimicrobium arenosum]